MATSAGTLETDLLWDPGTPIDPNRTTYFRATEFETYTLDVNELQERLADAPLEFTEEASNSDVVVTLPRPDGRLERFTVFASPIMEAGLAAQFPEIQTYAGQGLDDPAAKVRFDLTPAGFHAQVLSPEGSYYIDPYYHLDASLYASYYATGNFRVPEASALAEQFRGSSIDVISGTSSGSDSANDLVGEGPSNNSGNQNRSGSVLRIYRAAVAASGEYTTFHGGTVASGLAAVVVAMNRVTGIYESELSIRMQLVANNALLIYTDGANDPYSNNNAGALLGENQTNLDRVIGSANYDIGHVFTTGGGGLAGLGVVGIDGRKAQGQTGLPTPIGDAFYVDYVAHEIGHQFGGNHTFNSSTGSCAGGNRNAATAFEPGSGSTIQAYAGICGSDDLQPNSDPYFHSISFDEMIRHVDQVIPNVGSRIATNNSIPTISAGADFVIPARTPFMLTAIGTDADANDRLTYSWEQRDLGPAQTLTAADNGSSPLFRAIVPTTSPTRFFPRLQTILTGTPVLGERLPTTNRFLNFRATVRDNRVNGGGVNTDDTRLRVIDTGTTFAVTSPSVPVTWDGLTQQPITWNVAGTNAGAINTPTVSIFFSTDGGLTFPTLVLANTPNDGSENIVVPNFSTTTGRFMVRGDNNVFFNINTANVTVVPAPVQLVIGTGVTPYVENSAPVSAAPNASVIDFSNTNFLGVRLTARFIQNSDASDVLSLISEGTGPGQFSFNSTRIFFGGVDFGGWSIVGNRLTVTFGAFANAASITKLIRSIGYSSTSESPNTNLKILEISLGAGLSGVRAIQATTLNDSPSATNTGLSPISEDVPQPTGDTLDFIMAGVFSDPDAGARFGGVAVIENLADPAEGTWYFSDDQGTTWAEIGAVDDISNSLLLSPTSMVGFKPEPNYFGSPAPLSVRVLDETFRGQFSSSILNRRIFLQPASRVIDGPVAALPSQILASIFNVNDPPVANLPLINVPARQDTALSFTLPPNLFTDIDSPVLNLQLIPPFNRSMPSWLTFDSQTRRFSGTPTNDDVGVFTFQLQATDDANASVAIPLTLTVANVNDAPEQLILQGQTIAENDLGVRIGAVSAFDPDPFDTLTFSTSDPRFVVREGALWLRSNASVNYEVEPTVTLTITATDNGNPSLSTAVPFLIQVIDRNEFFPDLATQQFVIPAVRTNNQLIGTVRATDGDTFQSVKYRIQQDVAGIFEIGETSGDVRLKSGAQVTAQQYTLFIAAYDNGTPSNARIVQFNVLVEVPNQFDPLIAPGQQFTISENARSGAPVGRVVASDADPGQLLTYSISTGPFVIDATSGIVSLAPNATLNFEQISQYTPTVQVTDNGSPSRSSSRPITINVSNVNDAPSAISLVNRNVPTLQKGFALSRIVVTDEDPASSYVFSTVDPRFEIRNGGLALRSTQFFAETQAGTTSTVDVLVTDAQDPSSARLLPLSFSIISNPRPWQNPVNRLDVNRDGRLSAIDALLIINALSSPSLGRGSLRVPRELSDLSFFDVDTSGDNNLTPLDVNLVLNALSNRGGSGEGESRRASSRSSEVWFDAFTSLEQERKRRSS